MGTIHPQTLRELLDRDVIVACHAKPHDAERNGVERQPCGEVASWLGHEAARAAAAGAARGADSNAGMAGACAGLPSEGLNSVPMARRVLGLAKAASLNLSQTCIESPSATLVRRMSA